MLITKSVSCFPEVDLLLRITASFVNAKQRDLRIIFGSYAKNETEVQTKKAQIV